VKNRAIAYRGLGCSEGNRRAIHPSWGTMTGHHAFNNQEPGSQVWTEWLLIFTADQKREMKILWASKTDNFA